MSETISSSPFESGHRQIYRNPNAGGVVYRVEFVDVGWVEFSVAPGAHFTLVGFSGVINVKIEDYVATGLRAIKDPDIETTSG